MTEQMLGTSAHFTVSYEDKYGSGQERAQAILGRCETDFSALAWMFNATGAAWNVPQISVTVKDPGAGGAVNFWLNGKPSIWIQPLDPVNDPYHNWGGDPGIADDAVCGMFVAELAEVLMAWGNQQGICNWPQGGSEWEGLSRALAVETHPNGMYGVIGPNVNQWLLAGFPDFVTTGSTSEVDPVPYGCAVLFLHYLHSQLGYDWRSICLAPGATLEAKYQALTGSSGGFQAMKTLLDAYGLLDDVDFRTDNPFPLLPNSMIVDVSATSATGAAGPIASTGTVFITPPWCDSPNEYGYSIREAPGKATVTARVTGAGRPTFAWTVNGAPLLIPKNAGSPWRTTNLTTTAEVHVDDASNPKGTSTTPMTVDLVCKVHRTSASWQGFASTMTVEVVGHPGRVSVDVGVTVQELVTTVTPYAATVGASVPTLAIDYSGDYEYDSFRCRIEWYKRLTLPIKKLIRVVWPPHGPQPPEPPFDLDALHSAVVQIRQIAAAIDELAGSDPRVAERLRTELSQQLELPSGWLGAE